MPEGTFSLEKRGELTEMSESPFKAELDFQELLARHPNLLAGDQIDPGERRRWLLVTREVGTGMTKPASKSSRRAGRGASMATARSRASSAMGVHQVEVSDLMRRVVKENLLRFDGRPLFPERIAYTVPYKLSEAEAHSDEERDPLLAEQARGFHPCTRRVPGW